MTVYTTILTIAAAGALAAMPAAAQMAPAPTTPVASEPMKDMTMSKTTTKTTTKTHMVSRPMAHRGRHHLTWADCRRMSHARMMRNSMCRTMAMRMKQHHHSKTRMETHETVTTKKM